jgi:hypothetical protein
VAFSLATLYARPVLADIRYDCNLYHGKQHLIISFDTGANVADVQDIRDGDVFADYSDVPARRIASGVPELALPRLVANPWKGAKIAQEEDVIVTLSDVVKNDGDVGIRAGSFTPIFQCVRTS